jgi:hypothetical protein
MFYRDVINYDLNDTLLNLLIRKHIFVNNNEVATDKFYNGNITNSFSEIIEPHLELLVKDFRENEKFNETYISETKECYEMLTEKNINEVIKLLSSGDI